MDKSKLGTKVISSRGSGECAPTSLTLRGVQTDLGPPGLFALTRANGTRGPRWRADARAAGTAGGDLCTRWARRDGV